jgi:trigger factor
MHGESLTGDALNTAVQAGVQQLLVEQNIRPALSPQVVLEEGYEPGKDAEVKVTVEALPEVPAPQVEGLKLERLTVTPDESAVDTQIRQLAEQSKRWEDAKDKYAAKTGDLVVMDFEGKVGGKVFEGGAGEGMQAELGAGQLIPGFEDQLVGAKAGEEREVKVTFPADYPAEKLAGKDAVFAVKVTGVKTAAATKVDEEFAKSLGLQGLDQLKELIRDQQAQELNGLTRTHMKRQLLDELAARHDFAVPESMVEAEYQNILRQLQHEASHEPDPAAALKEIEADADEYRRIAERRVRLGLLLSEVGAAAGVEVSEPEMNRLIAQAAAQYQGKDRDNFIRYVQQEPMAAAQLRAPLYEDKVVDYLFSTADVTDRAATREQLEADLESEEGHVHGPGCGHDHAAPVKAKKPAAKKGKAEAAKAEEPAKGPVEAKPTAKAKTAKPVKNAAPAKAPVAKKAEAKPAKAEAKPAKAAAKPAKAEAKPPAKPAAKKAPAKKK